MSDDKPESVSLENIIKTQEQIVARFQGFALNEHPSNSNSISMWSGLAERNIDKLVSLRSSRSEDAS